MSQIILNSGNPSDLFIAASRDSGSTPKNKLFFWMSGMDSGNPRIDLTDRLITAGAVTREIKTEIGKTAQPVAAALTINLSNDDGWFSDQRTDSLFYNRYYINSHIRLWSGWALPNGNTELLPIFTGRVDYVDADSQTGIARMASRDILKDAFETYVGLNLEDGTRNSLIYKNDWNVSGILTDLFDRAGISGNMMEIENPGLSLTNVTFTEKKIIDAAQQVAESVFGYIYSDGYGRVTFKTHQPSIGEETPTPLLHTRDFTKIKYKGQESRNFSKLVICKFASGLTGYAEAEDTTLPFGQTKFLEVPLVTTQALADDLAEKNLAWYGAPFQTVDISNIYLPQLDIADKVEVTDPNLGFSSKSFEIAKIYNNISNYTSQTRMTYAETREKWGYAGASGLGYDLWPSGDYGFVCGPSGDGTLFERPDVELHERFQGIQEMDLTNEAHRDPNMDGTYEFPSVSPNGLFGNCAYFNGGDDRYLMYQSHQKFNLGEGTLRMWVKPDWGGTEGDVQHHFFDNRDRAGQNGFRIYRDAADKLTAEWDNAGSTDSVQYQLTDANFAPATWHQIMFAWEKVDWHSEGYLYLDGSLANSDTNMTNLPTMVGPSQYIGSNSVRASGTQADARMDELTIYKRVLAASEVTSDWNGGTGVALAISGIWPEFDFMNGVDDGDLYDDNLRDQEIEKGYLIW